MKTKPAQQHGNPNARQVPARTVNIVGGRVITGRTVSAVDIEKRNDQRRLK